MSVAHSLIMRFSEKYDILFFFLSRFFFFKQKTAYEIGVRLVGSEMCIRDRVENDSLLILRNTVEGERPVGFASYREIGNDELYGVLKDMELANLVRGKSSREILLITGIYAREENTGDSEMIRDAAQQLLVEVVAKELEKNYSFALFVAERGTAAKHVVYALERQGFVRPHLADENDKRTIYLVDMHEPLMFLHNLETTIKEPFASNPAVLRAIEKNHKKLQIAMTKLYPGNLVLSLSSGVMHHRLVDRITSLNDVPREPLVPRRLGKNMCVPFGKILRGKVVPNTVTKTLHTDKVYEPDLESYTIEPFPYYSPLNSQIETIRSFDRPVILVDDLVHKADRLRVLVPKLRETGIPIKKVVVGVLSGYGRDLMQHCLLYTSDAADEEDSVDLGGRRITNKKKKKNGEETEHLYTYRHGRGNV